MTYCEASEVLRFIERSTKELFGKDVALDRSETHSGLEYDSLI